MQSKKLGAIVLFGALFFGSTASAQVCPTCQKCPEVKKECLKDTKHDGWNLSTALGFNLTRGNTDTLLLNVNAKATKEEGNDIYRLEITGAEGEDKNKVDEKFGSTTQRKIQYDAEYKHLISDRVYLGVGATGAHDEIADIDYRYILKPAIGYFLIKDKTFANFSVEAGPAYVFEKLGGVKNDYFSPRIAERFEWFISDTATFYEAAEVLFNVDDGDDTLVNAEAGLEAAINSSINLVVALKDVYDNLPAAGKERNDLAVVTGLQIKY